MLTTIILSFFGLSCLASIIVFAACVASSRADQIQQGAFRPTLANAEQLATVGGQQATANPSLTLASSSV
jgi:hypothetical protein